MISKMLYGIAAAVLFNVAGVTPADAQVKAALTRDVDRPSAQPVGGDCNGKPNVQCQLFAVPAGKRLVVETVSYTVITVSGAFPTFVLFGPERPDKFVNAASPYVFSVTPTFSYTNGGSSVWSGTQALRISFDENQVFAAQLLLSQFSGETGYFHFSGYLVDK